MWVLRTKPRSCARATIVITAEAAISPVHGLDFLKNSFFNSILMSGFASFSSHLSVFLDRRYNYSLNSSSISASTGTFIMLFVCLFQGDMLFLFLSLSWCFYFCLDIFIIRVRLLVEDIILLSSNHPPSLSRGACNVQERVKTQQCLRFGLLISSFCQIFLGLQPLS